MDVYYTYRLEKRGTMYTDSIFWRNLYHKLKNVEKAFITTKKDSQTVVWVEEHFCFNHSQKYTQ
jgi:hypothetical protein